MPDRPATQHSSGEAELLNISVTVLAENRQRPLRDRIGRLRRRLTTRIIVVVAGLLAIGAVILGATCLEAAKPGRGTASDTSAGPAGVAAAYGYPKQCLSITIFPQYPEYARADFDHSQPCGRYSGDATAIFLRVDHAWRLVLNATTYSCPVRRVPARVQAALGVCETPPR